MIRLESIQRRYVSDEVETTALADINLEVADGEFLAIAGDPAAQARPRCGGDLRAVETGH